MITHIDIAYGISRKYLPYKIQWNYKFRLMFSWIIPSWTESGWNDIENTMTVCLQIHSNTIFTHHQRNPNILKIRSCYKAIALSLVIHSQWTTQTRVFLVLFAHTRAWLYSYLRNTAASKIRTSILISECYILCYIHYYRTGFTRV